MAVHVRSVGGLQIPNSHALTGSPHFGVLTRDFGVIEHDLDIGASTNNERQVANAKGATVTDDKTGLTFSTHEVSFHLNLAWLKVVIDENLNFDRPHEGVTLRECVLAHRLFKLTHQRLLKSFKALSIRRAEPYANRIGRDLALARKSSSQIHFSNDARAD